MDSIIISWTIAGFLLGWVVNYLADVLPISRQIQTPVCLTCGSAYHLGDYFLLRGCATCGKRRGLRSGLVVIVYIALGLSLAFSPPTRLSAEWAFLCLGLFGLITIIDLEHRLILHVVSGFGAIFGLALGISMHGLLPTLIGGAVGFAIMLVIYYFGELFSKVVARIKGQAIEEVALGFGDVNLSGVLGLILGWPGITACLFGAIFIGGIVSGVYLLAMYLLKRYKLFTALPYAPFLIASALLLLFRPV
jgi:leader peptidase (prepilin peptidase) / N-methyltransferase